MIARSLVVLCLLATVAQAAPAEPTGAHPRLLLDAELRAAWKASADRGPVKGAITLCSHARDTAEHDRAVYQGSEWAKVLQACLVAWAATGQQDLAKTAIRFYTALLDDLDKIGDKGGGENAAKRDDGYAIRNLGPYTALAYDWLHDQLSEELRARGRARWKVWLDWYQAKGYRARVPGTNYQAGYLVAATLIAIAQGGEAGEYGGILWKHVADELWGKDMAAALAQGGILDGGDWPEGWQYGPLAVASYALGARVAKRAGIAVAGVDAWLAALLRRHVYGLTPGDRVWAGGDAESEKPYLDPHVMTLNAIALGDAPPEERSWARGELQRLKLIDADYLLYDALATVGAAAAVPRESWPTSYVSTNTGTLYARTRWDAKAVWFVAECHRTIDVDHRSPNAGNFVLSRGVDDVIVDPSPYGSRSTLTGNAPTVASAQLPADYIPSQGYWGGAKAGVVWAQQSKSGVAVLRCDYADQYRFQDRASDVPEAIRDLVLVPSADGTDATLVVVDRARTGAANRAMHLRFRSPILWGLNGKIATSSNGATKYAAALVAASGGAPTLAKPDQKDCFKDGIKKGQCDAARFPVMDYRLEVPGPEPRAVHAISVAGGTLPEAPQPIEGEGYAGVRIAGARPAVVVWPTKPGAALTYRGPKGALHVVLDTAGAVGLTAKPDGDGCAITAKPPAGLARDPAVVALDDACAVTVDPARTTTAPPDGVKPPPPPVAAANKPRSGCCGAQTTPSSPIATSLVVGLLLLRRRRPISRRGRCDP